MSPGSGDPDPGYPEWYKDAILYEVRIPSFYDSNGDGIGDIRGLTQKLDYLVDLGVNTVWVLPFYPSPRRDDGYDIADYMNVHPDYGTLRDFRTFLREAHRRGLRVVTELVLNHTSDQHPWFRRARSAAPGGRWRDFYVWSQDPERYSSARIIFKDYEHSNWSWDPVAKAYYWHRFFSHQPDLNYDNPEVRKAVLRVLDFWLEMGVDGLRLDAVPYLFEREGTSCENLPETHAFLRELRAHVDKSFSDRMLLAEANQWPEDAVAYFGDGDMCHMAFHFPIMPRLFMGIRMENRFPILDILEQTPAIPDPCQWALFLRNHDELTLEMVTDEERDYMWKVYARDPRARINLGIRRRLAPLLDNDPRKIELMNALLFSLPGTPVIYYGDEIGMGDNVYLGDRNAVRTPMQWSPDRNAGFSMSNPQRLFQPVVLDPEYHYEAVNVAVQQANPSSLLWWTKRILALRKQYRAFGRGSFEPLEPENRRVLAYLRRFEDEAVLVVANLSRFSQCVDLDLSRFSGRVPLEVFGHSEFPAITHAPYRLTLGPHGFFWFSLGGAPSPGLEPPAESGRLPQLTGVRSWREWLDGAGRDAIEPLLPRHLRSQRWYRSTSRPLRSVELLSALPLADVQRPGDEPLDLVLLRAHYADGEPETYVTAFSFCEQAREGAFAHIAVRAGSADVAGVLCDASEEPRFARWLVELAARRRRHREGPLELQGVQARTGRSALVAAQLELPSTLHIERPNTSIAFGHTLMAKLYRRLDEGPCVEVELLGELTRKGFPHAPVLCGHVDLRWAGHEPATIMVLSEFVANEGDAFHLIVEVLGRYFEESLTDAVPAAPAQRSPHLAWNRTPPTLVSERAGFLLDLARRVGDHTAALHEALAAADDPARGPEDVTPFAQRGMYQSVRNLQVHTLDALSSAGDVLAAVDRELAARVLDRSPALGTALRALLNEPAGGRRIRCHGDYHLGQLLYTGKDLVMVDFEGDAARPLSERRHKRSPLVDVAGMLRSFHYAVEVALAGHLEGTQLRPEDRVRLEPWARHFYVWSGAAFLNQYLERMEATRLLPPAREDSLRLLHGLLFEKALQEVGYELRQRPTWAGVPLRGILDLLNEGPETP